MPFSPVIHKQKATSPRRQRGSVKQECNETFYR
jgi:hypothetical protein